MEQTVLASRGRISKRFCNRGEVEEKCSMPVPESDDMESSPPISKSIMKTTPLHLSQYISSDFVAVGLPQFR